MAFVLASGFETAHAVEPNLADYTSYPVFMANTVEPNILIMLDNSNSMNGQAYTAEYGGSILDCGTATGRLTESTDDAEENRDDDSVLTNTTNLFLGGGTQEVCILKKPNGTCKTWGTETFGTMVGLRFPNIEVAPGDVITNAYITFQAYANGDGNAAITIRGEDVGDASAFGSGDSNISDRADTGTSVSWNIGSDWFTGSSYDTPDLTSIVQEIVDRGDWDSNHAMAFTFSGSGTRSVRSWDYGGGTSGPVLVIEYDDDCSGEAASTRYYGYFDPDARYS
jgi:hypothetical protein